LTVFGPGGNTGRWTDDEQDAFLKALKLYKNDWKQIATMLPSRTLMQIRTHAQKYFKKQAKAERQRASRDGSSAAAVGQYFQELAVVSPRNPAGQLSEKFQLHQKNLNMAWACTEEKDPNTEGKRRTGRWTKEEEAYANRLIEEFTAGLLPMHDGRMLRMFLAKALNCDPMRISKKFVGNSAIGKQVYKRAQDKIDLLTTHELQQKITDIAALESAFESANKEQSERQILRKAVLYPSQREGNLGDKQKRTDSFQVVKRPRRVSPPNNRSSVRTGSFGLVRDVSPPQCNYLHGACHHHAVPYPSGENSALPLNQPPVNAQPNSPTTSANSASLNIPGLNGSIDAMINLLDEIRPRSFSTSSLENFLASSGGELQWA
jgi:SHAQKYF class myb-like DNA-binding protein